MSRLCRYWVIGTCCYTFALQPLYEGKKNYCTMERGETDDIERQLLLEDCTMDGEQQADECETVIDGDRGLRNNNNNTNNGSSNNRISAIVASILLICVMPFVSGFLVGLVRNGNIIVTHEVITNQERYTQQQQGGVSALAFEETFRHDEWSPALTEGLTEDADTV